MVRMQNGVKLSCLALRVVAAHCFEVIARGCEVFHGLVYVNEFAVRLFSIRAFLVVRGAIW